MVADYKIIDMPSMLSRHVTTQDSTNPAQWIRDESWYDQIRAIYCSLYNFMKSHELFASDPPHSSIDDLVVRISNLNEKGQRFIKGGADEKWLAAFDKPGSKKVPTDVSQLERALRRLEAEQPGKFVNT